MCTSWVLLIYIFGQLVNVCPQSSQEKSIKIESDDVDEYASITLRCAANVSRTNESFQWILNDTVIATNYADERGGIAGQRWRFGAYTATLTQKGKNGRVFTLHISNSLRSNTGQWSCRVNGTASSKIVVKVRVLYKPDSMYPMCKKNETGTLGLQCTTQKGKPQVSLKWLAFDQTILMGTKVTEENIIHYRVSNASLIPPIHQSDSLTCQMKQEKFDEVRRCSVSSLDIYSVASITLSRIVDQLNGFICTVTPSRFSEYLRWEIGTDQLSPEEENLGANGTQVIFHNIDSKWNGTIIKCVLKWGAWNDTHEIEYLLVDNPTTVLPLTSTNTPEENLKPENTPTEVPDSEGDSKRPTNRVIPPSERNTSSINPTVDSGIEMFSAISATIFSTNKLVTSTGSTKAPEKNMKRAITSTKISDNETDAFTITSIVFSTNELMDSPATAFSFSGALLIILVVVILAVVVLLSVMFCLWRSKKDSPKATVV